MSNEFLLKAENIKKDYFDGPRVLCVLKGISLEVRRGESIAIIGVSGAGKSTLLHLLGALDRPTSGEVFLDGVKYSSLSDRDLAQLRNEKVGFIFQFHHLLPEFNALENVMIPTLIGNKKNKKDVKMSAEKILRDVGLGDRLSHRPAKLSGGEQQRVALARALINNPDIILADEPTGDLDDETAQSMVELIWEHTIGKNKSLVIVTHNSTIANKASRILRLDKGVLRPFQ